MGNLHVGLQNWATCLRKWNHLVCKKFLCRLCMTSSDLGDLSQGQTELPAWVDMLLHFRKAANMSLGQISLPLPVFLFATVKFSRSFCWSRITRFAFSTCFDLRSESSVRGEFVGSSLAGEVGQLQCFTNAGPRSCGESPCHSHVFTSNTKSGNAKEECSIMENGRLYLL